MAQPGRSYNLGTYRFSFNGKEHDDEVYGTDNLYEYGERFFDPRLSLFISKDIDKLVKEYPGLSPYQYASLNPILNTDLNGLEGRDAKTGSWVPDAHTDTKFAVTNQTYQLVKNWYATDGGTNNPTNLQVQAPKENFTYVYTPPSDPGHLDVHGYNPYGAGYWYAENLKAPPAINETDEDGTPRTGQMVNFSIGAGNTTSADGTKYLRESVEKMIDDNQAANNQTPKDVTRIDVGIGNGNYFKMKPEDVNHLKQDLKDKVSKC